MLKTIQVIILSTNQKVFVKSLVISPNTKKMSYKKIPLNDGGQYVFKDLYFISDETICETCWCLDLRSEIISPFQYFSNSPEAYRKIETAKKIIATTDESLMMRKVGVVCKPSEQFVLKYVEEYNKGNVITEVLVEYEDKVAMDGHTIIGSELKISKDNTITIRKVKESFSI